MASLGNTTSITAIVTNSVGTVYIAGQFTVTDNKLTSASAYNVAKWDGITWTLLDITETTLNEIKTMILNANTLIVTTTDKTLSIDLNTQVAISLTNISATVMVNDGNTLYYITVTGANASITSAIIGASSTIGTPSTIPFTHGSPTGLNFAQGVLYVTNGTDVYKSDGTKLILDNDIGATIVEFTFYKSQLFIITETNLYIYELTTTNNYTRVVTFGITNAKHISVNRAIIITGTHGEIYSYSNMFLEAVLNEYNAIVAQNIQIQTQLSNLVNIYSIDDKKVHYQSQQTDYLAKIYYYLFILYYICAIISIYFIVKSDKNKYIKAGIIIYIFIYPYIVNPVLYRIYEMLTYLYALISVNVYTP